VMRAGVRVKGPRGFSSVMPGIIAPALLAASV